MEQIIKSILDSDAYKFSMQQAVLNLFPETVVEYRFSNRGKQRFTPSFLAELQNQIQAMSTLSLSNEEYLWIKENIPFLYPSYVEYLKNYRFNPSEVQFSLDGDNNLVLSIKGTWHSTILWEVPLMAIISELYFRMIDIKWEYDDQEFKRLNKIHRLSMYDCRFADFGTRRRRSYKEQNDLVQDFVRYNHIDFIKYNKKNTFVGTSNVHLAMKYNTKPIGTMAHEWIMGVSVLESLRHANYYALQNWVKVYNADLGIALTDTFGTPAFFNNFNVRLAKLYDGVRHDSGSPIKFGDKVITHYMSLGIDPTSKTIVFSDGLDVEKVLHINQYFQGRIKTSFGIGTYFTNDFKNSPALNMVIKLWSCNNIPVVKLSDTNGKIMGDADAVRVAQWTFYGKPL